MRTSSCGTSLRVGDARVTVMQSTQHGGGDASPRLCGAAFRISSWNALSDPLVWPRAIVVIGVFPRHTAQVVSNEDERVVKAFPSSTANAPLADSVRFQCLAGWCLELVNTGAPGDRRELLAVLCVAVVKEVPGTPQPRECLRGAAALPRHPWDKWTAHPSAHLGAVALTARMTAPVARSSAGSGQTALPTRNVPVANPRAAEVPAKTRRKGPSWRYLTLHS